MRYDVLIRNGHIYDPGLGMDRYGNIGVQNGRIASLDASDSSDAYQTIDAKGGYVVPGLIDIHTHVSRFATHIGLNPDIACIPNAVSMVVDCGSSGVSNYEGVLRTLREYEIRSRLVLHVSAGGQMMSVQFAENSDPHVWDVGLFEDAFRRHPDEIVGLKIRASRDVLGKMGTYPIERAVKLAEHLGTRLFVHATDPVCSMSELCQILRPGDVLCHMYHGEGQTLLSSGKVEDAVFEAQRNGLILDVSQGQGNFSLPLTAECLKEGLYPDTISTDINIPNWNSPMVFSLLMTMSKMLALGLDFERVIKGVTCNPAKVLKLDDDLGTLREGTIADISVLDLVDVPTIFRDRYGNSITADKKFVPMATIIDGRVQFQSSDTIYWK